LLLLLLLLHQCPALGLFIFKHLLLARHDSSSLTGGGVHTTRGTVFQAAAASLLAVPRSAQDDACISNA
jgi:hypothetical protein